jgi:hypothetical protein
MAGRTPDKYRNNQCIRLRPLRLKGEAAISICCSFSYNSFFISCSKLATHVDGALFGDCELTRILVLAELVADSNSTNAVSFSSDAKAQKNVVVRIVRPLRS